MDTIRVGEKLKLNLLKGKAYKLVAGAGSSGRWWLHSGINGTAPIESQAIAAGQSKLFGPFTGAMIVHAQCDVGSLTVDIVDVQLEVVKFGSAIKKVTASTYALSDADHGMMLDFQGGCAVTLSPGLRSDFSCGWSQSSPTAITFVAGSGVTAQDALGGLASAGLYKQGGIAAYDFNTIRVF